MTNAKLNDPSRWLADTALQLGATVENNRLTLSKSGKEGSACLFTLEEGLTMILTEVNADGHLSNLRLTLPQDYLFIKLYLPDFHLNTLTRGEFEYHQILTPGVLLYNSQLRLRSIYSDKKQYRIVSFAIQASWLKRTFISGSVFANGQLFETPLFRFEQVSPALLQSALNLFNIRPDAGPQNLKLKATAYDILSQLFSAFEQRGHITSGPTHYQSDIDAVFRVREKLLNDAQYAFPTIAILAQQAAMSPSKLKTVFRSVFGQSIFEFYQYHRLSHARHLIEGRQLSIKEIGAIIGYHNLSKFARAYKKQFGCLPHRTALPDRAGI